MAGTGFAAFWSPDKLRQMELLAGKGETVSSPNVPFKKNLAIFGLMANTSITGAPTLGRATSVVRRRVASSRWCLRRLTGVNAGIYFGWIVVRYLKRPDSAIGPARVAGAA